MEFYVSLAFHHLYYNSELHNDIELCFTKPKPIQFLRFRNSKDDPFSPPNHSFRCLLSGNMTSECIIKLLQLMLLEKKMIIISENYGESALMIEALLSLIRPM
jgi:hypothetical protein